MKFRFTKHAIWKLERLKQIGISLTKLKIKSAVTYPEKTESKPDGTFIAMVGLDYEHVLRVVYREEPTSIVIITLYPGRRKQYGLPLRS